MTRVMATLHRHTLWLIAALAVGAYVAIYTIPLMDSPVRSDGLSYYVYLPFWVVYHDVSLETVANRRFGGEFPGFSGLTRWPGTGRWVNPHPMGVAVLALPFYLVGDTLTRLLDYPAEGFSFFYRHSAGLAGAAYLVAGLFFLRRLLGRHFPPASFWPRSSASPSAPICFTPAPSTACGATSTRSRWSPAFSTWSIAGTISPPRGRPSSSGSSSASSLSCGTQTLWWPYSWSCTAWSTGRRSPRVRGSSRLGAHNSPWPRSWPRPFSRPSWPSIGRRRVHGSSIRTRTWLRRKGVGRSTSCTRT